MISDVELIYDFLSSPGPVPDHADVITLHHNRIRPGDLDVQPARYKMLRETFQSRMEAMTAYVQEEGTCRQAFLLDYFGEKEASPCGRCDVCRSRKKRPAGARERIHAWVDARGGKYAVKDFPDRESLDLLREMIDAGEVPPPSA